MFFININGGSLSTPQTKERGQGVKESRGQKSEGFEDSRIQGVKRKNRLSLAEAAENAEL
jgi:hypothetical protein